MIFGPCEVCGDDGLVLYNGHQWCAEHLSLEARAWALETIDAHLHRTDPGVTFGEQR